jgi:hypothetical protein
LIFQIKSRCFCADFGTPPNQQRLHSVRR